MRASPAVRGLRAAVFAALCVLLAAGFVAVFAGGCLLGGRERSLLPLGGATLAAQGGLHLAFGAARPHAVVAVHGMRMHPSHALTPHAGIAHVSAALLLTWWLRRGEAALWSLLRRAVAGDGTAEAATVRSGSTAASASDSTARGLGIAGLVVGVLGLAAAAFAVRRRGTAASA